MYPSFIHYKASPTRASRPRARIVGAGKYRVRFKEVAGVGEEWIVGTAGVVRDSWLVIREDLKWPTRTPIHDSRTTIHDAIRDP